MRLIEANIPDAKRGELGRALDDLPILDASNVPAGDDRSIVRLLVRAKDSDAVLDAIQRQFGNDPGFRVMLLKVEATLPLLKESATEDTGGDADREETPRLRFGVSREELYARVVGGTEVSQTYVLTVVLSTVVAAVGLWRDEVAVIIAAIVIAPLLGPNVALALATTLADQELSRKALRANLAGVALTLAVSLAVGWFFVVDPSVDAIASRTRVGPGDIVLALAAGSASALAYTTSVPAALIGVMVAVALLPPTVVFGLLLASGRPTLAAGAAMLLLANVICVNLAGVVTFLWQGVQPRAWWEAERARERTRRAIAIWLVLLGALILLMTLAASG